MSKFTSSESPNVGFWMEFENGYEISVQWSKGNSCSNHLKAYPSNESATAEIQVTDSGGKHQEPIGWLTADEVAKKIQEIASISVGKKWVFDFV